MIEKNSISLLLGAGASVKFNAPTVSVLNDFIFKNSYNSYDWENSRYIPKKRLIRENTSFTSEEFSSEKFPLDKIENLLLDLYQYLREVNKALNYEDVLGLVRYYSTYLDKGDISLGFGDIKLIKEFVFSKLETKLVDKKIAFILKKMEIIILARFHLYFEEKLEKYSKGDLRLIEELINEKHCKSIITLNNDCIIEELFEMNKIKYNDGFDNKFEIINDFDSYTYFYKYDASKVNFFKLHGSFNYLTYFAPGNEVSRSYTLKCDYTEIVSVWALAQKANIERKELIFHMPKIIAGSLSKEQEYSQDYYFNVIRDSTIELGKTNVLIVIGYSFGDDGVNKLINNWINLDTENQLFIIDPYLDFNYGTLATWSKSENLENRIHLINRKVENVSYNDLINFIKEKKRVL
ncbi:MAG: SIR2 family protein [Chlorobiota bacterium]